MQLIPTQVAEEAGLDLAVAELPKSSVDATRRRKAIAKTPPIGL